MGCGYPQFAPGNELAILKKQDDYSKSAVVENLSRSIPALLKSLLAGACAAGDPGPVGHKHCGCRRIAISARRAGQAIAKGGIRQYFIVLVLLAFWSGAASAQELTPRAYWPTPEGTRAVFVGYSRATGDVLFDPSIPM